MLGFVYGLEVGYFSLSQLNETFRVSQICLTSDDPLGIESNKYLTLPGLNYPYRIRTHVALNKAYWNSSQGKPEKQAVSMVKLFFESGGTSSLCIRW